LRDTPRLKVHDTYVSEGASGCVITSANDGTHKAESLHYSGQALDFRTHGLREKGIDPASLVAVIAATLGPDFDVLLEDPSTINEHIHVEWQEE